MLFMVKILESLCQTMRDLIYEKQTKVVMTSNKIRCPDCKKNALETEVDDCVFCGGGEYYSCSNCGSQFEKGKRGKVGEEL